MQLDTQKLKKKIREGDSAPIPHPSSRLSAPLYCITRSKSWIRPCSVDTSDDWLGVASWSLTKSHKYS